MPLVMKPGDFWIVPPKGSIGNTQGDSKHCPLHSPVHYELMVLQMTIGQVCGHSGDQGHICLLPHHTAQTHLSFFECSPREWLHSQEMIVLWRRRFQQLCVCTSIFSDGLRVHINVFVVSIRLPSPSPPKSIEKCKTRDNSPTKKGFCVCVALLL